MSTLSLTKNDILKELENIKKELRMVRKENQKMKQEILSIKELATDNQSEIKSITTCACGSSLDNPSQCNYCSTY